MPLRSIGITALICFVPIFELRGAIPYAFSQDVSFFIALPLCIVVNALVGPFVFIFLSTLHKSLSKVRWYGRFFDYMVGRARKRVHDKIEKYGYLGLALFVAIPLPITGAYTGALGAWVLGLKPIKSFLAITLGVCIAGIVVSLVAYLGIEALSLFIKKVSL